MMTKHEDYRITPPPASVDITGDIIPTADVNGKTPLLRKEDFYYLREMCNLVKGGRGGKITKDVSSFYDGRDILSLIKYIIPYQVYFGDGYQLTEGTMNWEGYVADTYNLESQFTNWVSTHNRSALDGVDLSPYIPKNGDKFNADFIRMFYHALSKAKYFACFGNGREGYTSCPPLRFTITPIEFSHRTLSYDNTNDILTEGSENVTLGDSGGSVTITSSGSHIQIYNIQGASKGDHKNKYYCASGMPTSVLNVPIKFSMPVTEAYAFMEYYVYAMHKGYKGYNKLVQLNGSGTDFNVPMFDPTPYSKLLNAVGVDTSKFDKWNDTEGVGCSCYCQCQMVYAKFDGLYIALPAEWDWQPS